MAITLVRVGFVDGMPILAEDMITLETNIEVGLNTHVHGNGQVVALDPSLIPAPAGAVGASTTVAAHLANEAIHYKPNTNLPNWYAGEITIPQLDGENPIYTQDVTFPGYLTADYRVYLSNFFPNGSVIGKLPEGITLTAEVLSEVKFRIHVKFIYNPYGRTESMKVAWLAVGTTSATDMS